MQIDKNDQPILIYLFVSEEAYQEKNEEKEDGDDKERLVIIDPIIGLIFRELPHSDFSFMINAALTNCNENRLYEPIAAIVSPQGETIETRKFQSFMTHTGSYQFGGECTVDIAHPGLYKVVLLLDNKEIGRTCFEVRS
ncbi:hypothetical protein [Brevibacillus dissolubilis]|uniref:hypothetical protein n=1 Tax=Brevibacillus dissolubilis TaxID=1844116 RepID=UPI0011173052|nr:hypothetical protein [Brevibacillus dissolubilis]